MELIFKSQNFQPHYGSGVDSASNKNENRKIFPGAEQGLPIRLTNIPPSVSQLSRSFSVS
jgi:hypothetical protein